MLTVVSQALRVCPVHRQFLGGNGQRGSLGLIRPAGEGRGVFARVPGFLDRLAVFFVSNRDLVGVFHTGHIVGFTLAVIGNRSGITDSKAIPGILSHGHNPLAVGIDKGGAGSCIRSLGVGRIHAVCVLQLRGGDGDVDHGLRIDLGRKTATLNLIVVYFVQLRRHRRACENNLSVSRDGVDIRPRCCRIKSAIDLQGAIDLDIHIGQVAGRSGFAARGRRIDRGDQLFCVRIVSCDPFL